MKNLIYTLALLITFSSYSQQVRQEVVQAQGDVYSAILDTYTGHELLVDTPKKVVFLVKKLLSGNGVVYRHTYDIKEDRFRYTVSMKTMLNGVPQQELDMTSEEEYKKYKTELKIYERRMRKAKDDEIHKLKEPEKPKANVFFIPEPPAHARSTNEFSFSVISVFSCSSPSL
mgnify:CR=1 FL=1